MKDQIIQWLQTLAVFELLVIALLGLIVRNLVGQLQCSGGSLSSTLPGISRVIRPPVSGMQPGECRTTNTDS